MDQVDLPTAYQQYIHVSRYARWLEDESGEIDDEVLGTTAQFFPEDFDGAMVEFEFQNLIRKGFKS